jgi:hypothetical protein
MKTIATVAILILISASLLSAHEMEGGSTSGLFGLKPEYLHVLINPLPVYGLAIAALVLASGLFARKPPIRVTGLVLVFLCAASAWPVLIYGQHGYNHLHDQLDTESLQWLDAHMARAEKFIYAFYATAAVAMAALLLQRKFPKSIVPLSTAALPLAITSIGLGAWISRAGGQIAHSEFRTEASAPTESNSPAHNHDEPGSAATNAAGQHTHNDQSTNSPHSNK